MLDIFTDIPFEVIYKQFKCDKGLLVYIKLTTDRLKKICCIKNAHDHQFQVVSLFSNVCINTLKKQTYKLETITTIQLKCF